MTAPGTLPHPLENCNVLLIDGPDGVGKSTYAAWVVAGWPGAVYMHKSRPKSLSWRAEHLNPVMEQLDRGHKVVMDRGPIGNPIWAQIFNDGDQRLFHGKAEYFACLRAFADLGARLEIVTRDPGDICHTLLERGESKIQIAQALQSIDMFKAAGLEATRYLPVHFVNSDEIHQRINNEE